MFDRLKIIERPLTLCNSLSTLYISSWLAKPTDLHYKKEKTQKGFILFGK
jgi:hypothetical protein